MNALSNHVLAVLFSWMRTLIEGAWGAVSSGGAGFFAWLGDHWLPVTVALCLVCMVLDYLIWLIRWRPYVIWRQKMRRLFRRDTVDALENNRYFRQGYRSSVALDLNGMQDVPGQAAWDAEAYAAPAPAPAADGLPDIPAFEQITYAAMEEENIDIPEPAARAESAPAAPYTRHRRRGRHEAPKRSLARRLIQDEDEDDRPSVLPPVVDKDEAFHKPVYPRESPYSAWQRHDGRNMNG